MTSTLRIPDYAKLQGGDWAFATSDTRNGPHGIHPYPAKFIPQIPATLIDALHPGDDSRVLDPFCGSGTTLLEAGLRGIESIGIDLHPLACLITKVKTTPIRRDLVEAAAEVMARAKSLVVDTPPIPALDHWFGKQVQMELAPLVAAIESLADEDVADALRIALSSIIVRVSNQESDTRYAAIDKEPVPGDTARLFALAVADLKVRLDQLLTVDTFRKPIILNQDILKVLPNQIGDDVSLVVTSPPYPNAYEYWLYHKYRMYWLGMDPIAVRKSEIGARPHYFSSKPQTAEDFRLQMRQVLALLGSVLRPGGHACFLIGTSKIHGAIIDNSTMIQDEAAAAGFTLKVSASRDIPAHRKAFNLKHSRLKAESVLVFQSAGRA